jgi:hypothetical protein
LNNEEPGIEVMVEIEENNNFLKKNNKKII